VSRMTLLVTVAAAALLAGCGSSSSSTTTSASKAATSTPAGSASSVSAGGGHLSLSETEFKITPSNASVANTGTITISVKNAGKVTHALAVQTPSGVVRTAPIPPGGSATLKVDVSKAGTYTMYCPIDGHRHLGMVGTLAVGPASSSAATSSSSSSSAAGAGGGYSY
jgi:uncharacterized cupredoxin-like copper-binding protein